MITFPLWFKIYLGLVWLGIIALIVRFFSKNKVINSLKRQPDEEKRIVMEALSTIKKYQKVLFFAIPLNLIIIPCLIYVYSVKNFFHFTVMISFLYLLVLEDYFYRRSVLKKLLTYSSSVEI